MNPKHLIPVLLFANLPALLARAEESDRIIVTANRLDTPAEQVASSVTVVTSKDIEQSQSRTVGEALRGVPGLSVISYGSPGQTTPVYIRGVTFGHTLVLIDGVKVNDPSENARAFDFANLSTEHIERIEVVRGAESVLYGSDSIGGVIHIITKKGAGPFRATAAAEYGAYKTYRTAGTFRGGDRSLNYSLSAEQTGTSGFSSASEYSGNTEPDGRAITSFSARLGAEPLEKFRTDLTARYSDARFDNDIGGGPGNDDPDYRSTDRRFSTGLSAKAMYSLWWQPALGLEYSLTKRTSRNEPDAVHPLDAVDGIYDGSRIKTGLQNNFFLSSEQSVMLLFEGEQESVTVQESYRDPFFSSRTDLDGRKAAILSMAAEHQYALDSFFSSAGARLDRHTRFGTHGTFRLAPGYKIESTGTTFKGSLGTGFKAPTIYQLFAGNFANPALKAETSVGIDAGIEQEFLSGNAKVSTTYFRNSLKDLIFPAGVNGQYVNIHEASSRGMELASSARFTAREQGRLAYTYTYSKEERTGLALQKVPRHQLSGEVSSQFSELGQARVQLRYVGTRLDVQPVFPYATVTMPSYWVLGLAASHSLQPWVKGLKAIGRIENLLDRRYEEVNGFGTSGRSLYFGLSQEI